MKKVIKKILKPFYSPFRNRYEVPLRETRADVMQLRMQLAEQAQQMDHIVQEIHELAASTTRLETSVYEVRDAILKDLFDFRFLYEKQSGITYKQTHSVYSPEFYENHRYYSYLSARQVFMVLLPIIEPKFIFDFGCGSGTWLYAAKRFGVPKVHGVDGAWVDQERLMIEKEEFTAADISLPYTYMEAADMACSLEVAEHLSADRADVFIDNLCKLSDVILFSAAHPGQGGDDHRNEQPYEYWEAKFHLRGYCLIDIRPIFVHNINICWWYRDNMALYVKPEKLFLREKLFGNE